MSRGERYRVVRIDEADFGCEELPEGYERPVELTLEAGDGTLRRVTAEERSLAAQGIDAGSRVTLTERGDVLRCGG